MTISFLLYIIHFGVFTLCKTEHPDDIIGGIYMRRAVLHEVRPYSGRGLRISLRKEDITRDNTRCRVFTLCKTAHRDYRLDNRRKIHIRVFHGVTDNKLPVNR